MTVETLSHSDTEQILNALAWLIANRQLVVQVFESVEVSFKVILCEHESQLAHDANVEVLVAEGGSEFDSVRLLDHLHTVLLVVEPGHANFEALINVVVWVGERVQILHDVAVQTTNHTRRVVELQYAQICQQLALLHIFELSAAHSGIQVVVLHRAAVMRDERERPGP